MIRRPPIATRTDTPFPYTALFRSRSECRFAPLAGRLENLPPALVVTAGQDVFADEGARYADALAQAGVPVVRHEEPGAFHAFLTLFPATQASARSRAAIGDFIAATGAGKGARE